MKQWVKEAGQSESPASEVVLIYSTYGGSSPLVLVCNVLSSVAHLTLLVMATKTSPKLFW